MAADQQQSRANEGTVMDVTARRVGAVYGKALLGAAEAAGQTEAVIDELDSFVDDILNRHRQLDEILSSARVAAEEKEGLLDRTLGSQASPLFLNFVKVLGRHGRFDAIRSVRTAVHEQYDQMRNRVEVEVLTAVKLSDDELKRLAEQLKPKFRRELRLAPRVDPGVVAGVVLRVGDTVYDGSLAAQLKQMRSQMITRSVHEIQSRRDRFGHPEGN